MKPFKIATIAAITLSVLGATTIVQAKSVTTPAQATRVYCRALAKGLTADHAPAAAYPVVVTTKLPSGAFSFLDEYRNSAGPFAELYQGNVRHGRLSMKKGFTFTKLSSISANAESCKGVK